MKQAAVGKHYGDFLENSSWYKHFNDGDAKEAAYILFGLNEEAGELAGVIKKIVREVGFDDHVQFNSKVYQNMEKAVLELGDVFWYAVKFCDFMGVTVPEVQILNTLKLYTRMEDMAAVGRLPIDMPKWPFPPDVCTQQEAHDLWERTFSRGVR